MQAVWAKGSSEDENRSEKRSKKSEKNPEKQLTNKSVCDRIDKLSETDGTLKRSSTRFWKKSEKT